VELITLVANRTLVVLNNLHEGSRHLIKDEIGRVKKTCVLGLVSFRVEKGRDVMINERGIYM